MKSNLKIMICIGICAVLLSATVVNVIGKAGGYYDSAQTGCGNCHGDTPTASLVITVTGVPATYLPLTVYPLTLTVSGGPASPSGGFNLEISAGTLSTTDGNVEINAALDQAVQLTDIGRTWDVDWTAPGSGTGNVNLWAVLMTGNDDDKKDAGDLWKLWSALVPEEGGPGDVEPPVISNVLINGAASQTYDISSIPALTLTATVDDSGTGNSDIGGANYTEGAQNWPTSAPMSLQSPPTSPTEDFEATIPAPGAAGTYYYYPYGWDIVPNYNTDSPEFATLIITEETTPPIISNVLINGAASQTYPLSAIPALLLTATVDDSGTGNSDIGGANYTEGAQNWPASAPMALQNPPTSPTEDFEATIPAPGSAGTYYYYPYGWDVVPNYNTDSPEYATLIITEDTLPPEISNVLLNGAVTQTYPLSAIPVLTLTATLDDSSTGGSDIGGANYTEGAQNWPSSAPMALQNPPTSPTEDFDAIIPAPAQPGTYTYYVYGWDIQPNNNVSNVLEFVTLTITDDMAPTVSNVLINGAASQTYNIASIPPLLLTATLDDSSTGGSDIGGANYTDGEQNWPSSAAMSLQNPPTSPTEIFEATIPAPGASGTYYYYPYGWDVVPNYNTNSPEYATLIITDETMPPEVSNVLLNGAATQTYPLSAIPLLTLTGTIDDSTTGNSDIGGANYTEGAQNWGTSLPMALQNPPTSPTEVFEAIIPAPAQPGTYTYYVYGWDIQPNYNTTNVLEFVTLTIVDDIAPTISNVLINGAASQTYDIASIPPLLLTATVDDSATGNSDIGGANYTEGAQNWPSSAPMALQNPPTSQTEVFEATIPAPGTAGTYFYYPYGWDIVPNYNTDNPIFATLTITEDIIPPLPPTDLRTSLGSGGSTTYQETLSDIPVENGGIVNDHTATHMPLGGATEDITELNYPGGPVVMTDRANADHQDAAEGEGEVVAGTLANVNDGDNDVYYQLRETETGGQPANRFSQLAWIFETPITGGSDVNFFVQAYHDADADGDDFIFQYSDAVGGPWTDMVTVTDLADPGTYLTYSDATLDAFSGLLYVRVRDTDWNTGNNAYFGSVWIDDMYFESGDTLPAYNSLEHQWLFQDVPAATTHNFHAFVGFDGGDDSYDYYYSTTGAFGGEQVYMFTDSTAALDEQIFDLGGAFTGPFYVQVIDTNSADASQDTVYIDCMYVLSQDGGSNDCVLNWTLSPDDGAGQNDVIGYNIYRADSEIGNWYEGAYVFETTVLAGIDSWNDLDEALDLVNNIWYYIEAIDGTFNSTITGKVAKFDVLPLAYNVLADGSSPLSIAPGTLTVALTAQLLDNTTTNENDPFMTGAEWFDTIDPGEGLGNAIPTPDDGTWDGPSEAVTIVVDSSSWLPASTHLLNVRGNSPYGWGTPDAVTVNVDPLPTYDIPIPDPAGPWPAWRLISFPIDATGDVEAVLNDTAWGDGGITWDYIQWYDGNDPGGDNWKTYSTFRPAPLNDLPPLDNSMGLWVHIVDNTGDAFLTMGTGVDDASTGISLFAGWNLIGYTANDDSTYAVQDLKAATGAIFLEGYDGAAPYRLVTLADTYVMTRGEAYWVFIPADIIWTIDW